MSHERPVQGWLDGGVVSRILAIDPKAAGWWLYVVACGIGDPFGPGPWRVIYGHLRDTRKLPHLCDAGQGALIAYFDRLASRLARVRITCGSWERVLKPSVLRATAGASGIGILLDPPYATSGDLYAESSAGISDRVREWCLTAPDDLRIVLCGYDNEHDGLLEHGWDVIEGKSGSGAGYSVRADNGRRDRLWTSPACLGVHRQDTLDFGEAQR